MQLVVVMAVRKAVSAATITFTATSTIRFFIQSQTPDYAKALQLTTALADAGNHALARLKQQLKGLTHLKPGAQLPQFRTTDINGQYVSNTDLTAKVNIISTWASWNYDSQNAQRKLQRLSKEHSGSLQCMGICLDGSKQDCRRNLDRDSIRWHTVCDGRMWEMPILDQLGLYFVPDNIIFDSKGRILAHSIPTNELDRKIEELLK